MRLTQEQIVKALDRARREGDTIALPAHLAVSGSPKNRGQETRQNHQAHPAPDQGATTRTTPPWLDALEKKAALRTRRLSQWRAASPSQRRTGRGPSFTPPSHHGRAQVPGTLFRKASR
jgi:hypothetical protein